MTELTNIKDTTHYDDNVTAMKNIDYFYDWLVSVIQEDFPQWDKLLCDIGSGTGELLKRLQAVGYYNLRGVDFSPGCVNYAREMVRSINFTVHNIENAPVYPTCEAIIMTNVLDFLRNPKMALINVRTSLAVNGLFILTIRNRQAYWPWYYLRHWAKYLNKHPKLHHWFMWFTTPLGMRRSDQPFEKVYSPDEVAQMLNSAGFTVIKKNGMMVLPMFWIPGFKNLTRFMNWLDVVARLLPVKQQFYIYLFICRSKTEL